ncbi:MAG: tRNA G10 N-methylase Trm11 [Oceanicoccus sp.]
MKNFIFQTGHGKRLAIKEIEAILGENSVLGEVNDGVLVEAEIEDAVALINTMGGIVRITEVIQSGPSSMPLNFESWVIRSLTDAFEGKSGKFRYGLSIHPKSDKILKSCLMGAKKKLKPILGNLRFVNKDFNNLSSVQAWHEGLLKEKCIELQLFEGEDKWFMCKTLAIQDFGWYSTRDYDRPAKCAKNGMFPPKLAQILINLSGTKTHVFDPFCGSGTVIQESLLRGLNATGSDLIGEMVSDSRENLEWLAKKTGKTLEYALFRADATRLTKQELPAEPFAIVTETWLGPRLSKPPTELELQKIQREIEDLYEAFFDNLKRIVQSPTIVVFTAPYHKDQNLRHFLPNLPEILARYTKIIPISDHERPSMFYERKNQLVSREIWKVMVG